MGQAPLIADLFHSSVDAGPFWLEARGFKPAPLPDSYRWVSSSPASEHNAILVVLTDIGGRRGVYLLSEDPNMDRIKISRDITISRIALLMEAVR